MFQDKRRAITTACLTATLLTAGCSEDKESPTAPVASDPIVTWQRTVGTSGSEAARAVVANPDGSFVAAGGIVPAASGDQQILLVKVDSAGELVWQREFGGSETDFGQTLTRAPDGGYVIGGSTYSFGVANSDVYLIKTDADGNLEWQKTYGGDKWETVYGIVPTSDGGFAAAGWTSSYDAPGGSDAFFIKTDVLGNLLWRKQFGGNDHDATYSVAETADGGFILTGETESFGAGSFDLFMVKTNANGEMVWQKAFGGTGFDRGRDVIATPSGYVAAGWIGSSGVSNHHGEYDVYVLKVNLDGQLLWQYCYGGAGYDGCEAIAATPDGGFAAAGHLQSTTTGVTTGYLLKINESGSLLWQRTYGNSSEAVEAVASAPDGGLIVAGCHLSEATGDLDVFLVKTNASGQAEVMPE